MRCLKKGALRCGFIIQLLAHELGASGDREGPQDAFSIRAAVNRRMLVDIPVLEPIAKVGGDVGRVTSHVSVNKSLIIIDKIFLVEQVLNVQLK